MRGILRGGACLLIAAVLASCDQQFDRSKVDSALAGLEAPYRNVEAIYYGDGGSVGIRIVDHQGRAQFFFVSAKLDEPNPYTRVSVGGSPGQDPSGRELVNPGATKGMLVAILRARQHRTLEEDRCLAGLSGHFLDHARVKWRRLFGE